MKKIACTLLVFCSLFSCNSTSKDSTEKDFKNGVENQLWITNEGDSLEIGFWRYRTDIDKSGFYEDGFKVGEWVYRSKDDSTLVHWEIFDNGNVKFNYPKNLEVIDSLEYPAVFQADIPDGNNFTYVVLLEYDLNEMNAAIYDYLYEMNKEAGSVEVLKSKEDKKFYFKNVDIFRCQMLVDRDSLSYEAVSYIFEVDGKLYDLTLRDMVDKIDGIEHDVFRDILYSMECNGMDLFSFGSRLYYKEEEVEFK